MHLPTLLLTTLTAALGAADLIEYCPFAQDKTGMLQHPYCCDSYTPSAVTELAEEGKNCQQVTEPVAKCPNGLGVKCCYTINQIFICTADAILEDD
ncbi:hypothetical protein BO82DRAFT_351516 [Aspergillus uvarum CBS 121591]|uniref:Hydrophobin n=1 Tax=Aspergillus uvarum CBS 121591 TaxID=1448315 RepID=A0A319CHN6_9EURO|nr:hypothetical protein BO82DRAFT_351516 [Aspergillus uvarum CBS 121591]PYH85175.1 hypothetical protein BO82DRAFT_351516 [Aspergillus uvarum CBS 121591]